MQVKGTGIKTTREFVKLNFPDRFDEWIDSLPPQTRKLYSGSLDVGGWFDINDAYYIPIDKIAHLFYKFNRKEAGNELGRYSAEIALKGIYKVFLLVATPQYLMKRAANMMQAFYKPSEIEISGSSKKHVIFKIKSFEGLNTTTEYRIAGWCAKALELCNCSNVTCKFTSHISAKQLETIMQFNWE